MKTTIFFLFMCVSAACSGQTVFIKGQPAPLDYSNELYYIPASLAIGPETTSLYVEMDGVNKVCFLNTEPALMYDINAHINILINGVRTEWNCFPYITTILEARP